MEDCVYILNDGTCDLEDKECIGSGCTSYEPPQPTLECVNYDDEHCTWYGISCNDWCGEYAGDCDEYEKKSIGIDLFT